MEKHKTNPTKGIRKLLNEEQKINENQEDVVKGALALLNKTNFNELMKINKIGKGLANKLMQLKNKIIKF